MTEREKKEALAAWWEGRTVADVVHEFAVVRGDLGEQYARDQLTELIEFRIALAGEQS